MVLTHLVKISGLVQILCNLSINLVYIVYLIKDDALPSGHMPRYLPFNVLLFCCIGIGFASFRAIDDKFLKLLLLAINLTVTVLLFILYANVFKNFMLK